MSDAKIETMVMITGREYEALRAEVDNLKSMVIAQEKLLRSKDAENKKLRAYALKAFTVVEFCSGQGFLLQYPSYDCDDLLMEGVDLLKVETSEEARAALREKR